MQPQLEYTTKRIAELEILLLVDSKDVARMLQ